MKFRIKETQNGHMFEIQYRHRLWFWVGSRKFGETLYYEVDGKNSDSGFRVYYDTYNKARSQLDDLLKYYTERRKRKRAIKRFHDIIDFEKEEDRFMENL